MRKRIYACMRDCERALFVLLIVVVLFSTLWMNHDSTIESANRWIYNRWTAKLVMAQDFYSRPSFLRAEIVRAIDCGRLLNDSEYAQEVGKKRIAITEHRQSLLSMDCESIFRRNYFPTKAASSKELQFPIAFARVVYKDYLVQEMLLAALYAPQNVFCYVIDSKSSAKFKSQMNALASCFDNVHITTSQFFITSAGRNMTRAQLACLELLVKDVQQQWKYAVVLQRVLGLPTIQGVCWLAAIGEWKNDDIPLRTNRELVEILGVYNGTNDVSVAFPLPKQVPKEANLSYASLRLFRNQSQILKGGHLKLAKATAMCTLSYAFARFFFEKLNVEILLQHLDTVPYSGDEIFFATLDSCDDLKAPGGFTQYCLRQRKRAVYHFTVKAIWYDKKRCKSRRFRHSVCILGVEDLPQIQQWPHFFVNKMQAQFDFTAISCQMEILHNRTSKAGDISIDLEVFKKSPRIRYRQFREQHGPDANISSFKC